MSVEYLSKRRSKRKAKKAGANAAGGVVTGGAAITVLTFLRSWLGGDQIPWPVEGDVAIGAAITMLVTGVITYWRDRRKHGVK